MSGQLSCSGEPSPEWPTELPRVLNQLRRLSSMASSWLVSMSPSSGNEMPLAPPKRRLGRLGTREFSDNEASDSEGIEPNTPLRTTGLRAAVPSSM